MNNSNSTACCIPYTQTHTHTHIYIYMYISCFSVHVFCLEGVANVIVYTPADEADKQKNRGFCFVDFDTHKNASVARRKLAGGRIRV
jgi:hypothetical protein